MTMGPTYTQADL